MYRDKGLQIGDFFLDMVKREHFLSVPAGELREIVLTNARFVSALYESETDPELNDRNLDILDEMLKISGDDFYINAVPGFDWRYYQFRVLGYYLQCTDNGNFRGFKDDQLERLATAADILERFYHSDPEYFDGVIGSAQIPFWCARNRYFAGKISEEQYRELLLEEYENRGRKDFSTDGALKNMLIPLELIVLIQNKKSAADSLLLKELYRNLSAYMFGIPNAGVLSFAMEYFIGVIRRFCEIPSVLSFEDFGLQTLAALHPPTYVHSRMVGILTECLCGYALDMKPEVLVGVLGTRTVEDVKANREAILKFAYHAALCHDFGKIMIIDTIFVYGRKLLDVEFDIIKSHPLIGSELLKQHESTRAYANVAKGHHRFYDDSKGYPEGFMTSQCPEKPIIDLVLCADCMDAATDSIGRSYNKGKSLDDFLVELNEGSGTRYAPWLLDIFVNDQAYHDVDFLLTSGRESVYKDTFILLKGVKEKGR